MGGLAKGVDDERDMFPQAIRSIRELCPRAFVFENVKGLLRESFRDYLTYILEQLRYPEITYTGDNWREHYRHIEQHKNHYTGLEYNVNLTLVNAADYGIPQKRERIIIVGIRKDLNIATGTMTKLRRNEEVALSVLLRICEYLECNIGDICDAVQTETEQNFD